MASGSVVGNKKKKTGSTTQHWRIADGVVANGQLEVYDQTNSKSMMAISTSGVVFNEDANDRDFRVESDSNDHAFAVVALAYLAMVKLVAMELLDTLLIMVHHTDH